MSNLSCPRCGNLVQKPASGNPVCSKCGYSTAAGNVARAAPTTYATPMSDKGGPVAGRLRPVSIGKAIGLGIITFGIYLIIRTYKMTGDLHRAANGNDNWQLWFWLGFFLGPVMLVTYFKNNKQLNWLGEPRGRGKSYTPFILACIPFVNIVAPFVWASNYNDVAARM